MPSLTIDCVQPVTKRLSTPHWLSIVSNQWPSVSVPALWQAVSNQWPNVSVSLSDDRLCPVSNQTSQYPSLTIWCVQPVTKRLNTPSLTIYSVWPVTSTPLWRSTASNESLSISIPLLWRSTVSSQWPNVSVLHSDDLRWLFSTDCPLEPSLYL